MKINFLTKFFTLIIPAFLFFTISTPVPVLAANCGEQVWSPTQCPKNCPAKEAGTADGATIWKCINSAPINIGTGNNKYQVNSPVNFSSLGEVISKFLTYLFPLAGLLLFAYLVMGGFSYLTSGGDPKATEQAKSKVTNAIVGFIILVVAYWIVQIFGYMFGITIF